MERPDSLRQAMEREVRATREALRRANDAQVAQQRKAAADQTNALRNTRAAMQRDVASQTNVLRDTRAAMQRDMAFQRAQQRRPAIAQRDSQLSTDDKLYRFAAAASCAFVALGAIALAVGHMSARVTHGAWPRYKRGEAPGIVIRLIVNPADPASAWEPVNQGGQPAGATAWWVSFAATIVVLALSTLLAVRLARRWRAGDELDGDDGEVVAPNEQVAWASRQQLRRLHAASEGATSVVVGRSGKYKVALEPLESLMVVGPAGAGKTSGVAIPALLRWPGPVLAASTKGHLMDETIGWRSHIGNIFVYDPAGVTGLERAGWSPLTDCGTWQGAIRTAQQLTAATKASIGGHLDGGDPDRIDQNALWTSAMAMALAPFLYAAAVEGRTMVETAEWLEREERDEVLAILSNVDAQAAHVHETTFFRTDPVRSEYFHIMFEVLSVYSDPAVLATADRHDIAPPELLDGRPDTLYLTASEHDNIRFQPLFATIVRQLVTAVNNHFSRTGKALDPPLLIVVDDAVGVAALDALGDLASTGASKGVQVITILEGLNRVEWLAPDTDRLLMRSHRAKLVMTDDIVPNGSGGTVVDLIPGLPPPEALGDLAADEGVLTQRGEPPVRVTLRRWYNDDELRKRAATPRLHHRAAGPERLPDSRLVQDPGYHLIQDDHLLPWRRRRSDSPPSVDPPS